MYNFLLKTEISEKTLLPCYFFYGEETFLAYQLINDIKKTLISPDNQDYNVERFNLEDHSWMDIIDLARTIPFFFSSRRIIIVEIIKGRGENISSLEEKILKDYFHSSISCTVLIIIFSGKLRKDASLLRIFSSFPQSLVCVKELKPLRDKALFSWMDRRFLSLGKSATIEAKKRLVELTGNDLSRLDNEMEKITTFLDERKTVELDDVNQVSGLIKSFFEWEISDNLTKADYEACLIVLNNLFREGIKPEYILGLIAKFFRDILLAKLYLKENDKDKKAIFKELKPHIREKFGKFYTDKFRDFFFLVDKISRRNLNHFLSELEKIDLNIKTSDVSAQTLLEGFLFDYCLHKRRERTI
ncbi:MAG: DNA polymerase III subunit delta [Candidatus Aminicenantes bacterium]|nr:MAG: DNA polymerase III subunit delta [Candidatus Aminicenantes bacterium]